MYYFLSIHILKVFTDVKLEFTQNVKDGVRAKKGTLTGFCHWLRIQITICTLTKISNEITRVSASGKVRNFSVALLADNSLGAHEWTGRLSIAISIGWEVKYVCTERRV